MVAGLRIGFTLTLLGVLLAEMFAAKHGLGFLIINAMQLLQAEEMITVAVVLFVFARSPTRCCYGWSIGFIAGSRSLETWAAAPNGALADGALAWKYRQP